MSHLMLKICPLARRIAQRDAGKMDHSSVPLVLQTALTKKAKCYSTNRV